MIYLVCGYKRTGKDYLVKIFNQEIKLNWVIYTKSSNHMLKFNKVNRVGFADKLRQEVN